MDQIILTYIKEVLGVFNDEGYYDAELLTLINGEIQRLMQMGVVFVVPNPYCESGTQFDSVVENEKHMSYFKQCIFLYTKTVFDASANTNIQTSRAQTLAECRNRFRLVTLDEEDDNE